MPPRDYARRSHQNRAKSRGATPRAKVWLCIVLLIVAVVAGLSFLRYHAPSMAPVKAMPKPPPLPAPTKSEKKPEEKVQFDFYTLLPDSQTAPVVAAEKPKTTTASPQAVSPAALREAEIAVISPARTPVVTPTKVAATPPASHTERPQAKVTRIHRTEEEDTSADPTPPPAPQKPSSKPTPSASTSTAKPAKLADKKSAVHPAVSQKSSVKPGQDHYILQIAALRRVKAVDQLKTELSLLGYEAKVTTVNPHGNPLLRIWLGPYAQAQAKQVQHALQTQHINGVVVKIR